MKCKNCEFEIDSSAKYCSQCGTIIFKKYSWITGNRRKDIVELEKRIVELKTENTKLNERIVELESPRINVSDGGQGLSFSTNNPDALLHIETDENVGIGGADPNAMLYVYNDDNTSMTLSTGGDINFRLTNDGDSNA